MSDKPWSELSFEERRERNHRSIMHELETPFWSHDPDGECCRRAALHPTSENDQS